MDKNETAPPKGQFFYTGFPLESRSKFFRTRFWPKICRISPVLHTIFVSHPFLDGV